MVGYGRRGGAAGRTAPSARLHSCKERDLLPGRRHGPDNGALLLSLDERGNNISSSQV